MRLWVLTAEGAPLSVLDPWHPAFHLTAPPPLLRRALALLARRSFPVSIRWTERLELFSGRTLSVLEVRVPPLARDAAVRRLKELGVTLYDADVHLVQQWHYERGHFPLARCGFETQDGRLLAFDLRDDPWAVDYDLPPLRTLHLARTGSEVAGQVDPNHGPRGRLALGFEGRTYELEGSLDEQLESLAGRLKSWDPDVITSDWGDSHVLPLLDIASRRLGRALPLSRDPVRGMAGRGERSFYTYGRTVYQTGIRYLFGRWHIDLQNSFLMKETGLDGLAEIARIARIPVQRASRCTIGTSLTSMQMCRAFQDGVLIPMDKQQAEDFRPADELLVSDKGGLVYEPDTGWHGEAAEVDFVSMYPTMMVRWNISPETVNCPCCPENKVPEIGHHLCRRRQGLVPKTLAPILEKRARYKVLAKAGGPRKAVYKARATAHKWTLVCCFGYLGFKNARFGKIEAHECVTACGREVLLKAKEAAEKRGFKVLHALVDSLWVTKEQPPAPDYEALRRAVEREAGCPAGLEGVYKWIRFCPSRMDPLSGVPNRYFGAFADGELKVRGIALRRRDTPALIKALQSEMLGVLAGADGLEGCRALKPRLEEIAEECRSRLREGRVTAAELAITFHLSKDPSAYVHDTHSALAARQLDRGGVKLHPGETVRFVIASARDRVKDWRVLPLALLEGPLEYDPAKYLELMDRAAAEILDGL